MGIVVWGRIPARLFLHLNITSITIKHSIHIKPNVLDLATVASRGGCSKAAPSCHEVEWAGRNTGQRLGPSEIQGTADGKLILLAWYPSKHTHTHAHARNCTASRFHTREESPRTLGVGRNHSRSLHLSVSSLQLLSHTLDRQLTGWGVCSIMCPVGQNSGGKKFSKTPQHFSADILKGRLIFLCINSIRLSSFPSCEWSPGPNLYLCSVHGCFE